MSSVEDKQILRAEMEVDEEPTIFTSAVVQDLIGLFECPVCYDCITPPIMQCYNGHLLCNACCSRLKSCPTCRGALSAIRNLAMEKVGNKLNFPCKFAAHGCNAVLTNSEKSSHEMSCPHRPYCCPCPGKACTWVGRFDTVLPHLRKSHANVPILRGDDILFTANGIHLRSPAVYLMMQTCFGFIFMLCMTKEIVNDDEQEFVANVLVIGSPKEAEQFKYHLAMRRERHRLMWEADTCSVQECTESPRFKSNCLCFSSDLAHYFVENDSMEINVIIKRRAANSKQTTSGQLFLKLDIPKREPNFGEEYFSQFSGL